MKSSKNSYIDYRGQIMNQKGKLMTYNTWVFVIGGGKFGEKALKYYEKTDKSLLFFDVNKNQLAFKGLKIIRAQDFSFNQGNKLLGIQGSVRELFKILLKGFPDYIIPTAPIHVMAHLFSKYFQLWKVQVQEMDISNKLMNELEKKKEMGNFPNHLIYSKQKNHLFFSYAPLGKSCPDSCMGKPGYCSYHKIQKGKTVTNVLQEFFKEKSTIIFKSHQISAGLGGIRGDDIKSIVLNLKNALPLLKLPKTVYIGTSCNCHGVVDKLELSK